VPLRLVAAVGLDVPGEPMNGAEARAANTVLRVLGVTTQWAGTAFDDNPPAPSSDEAMQAAAFLADRANRVTGAGYSGQDVGRCWPAVAARLAAVPTADLNCEVCGRAKVHDAGRYLVCPDDSDEHAEQAAEMHTASSD
jgi:hypothetical protein